MTRQKAETAETVTVMVDTAFGKCGLVFRENPFTIVRVFLPGVSIRGRQGRAGGHPEEAQAVAQALVDYFDGKKVKLPWRWFDMSEATHNQQKVLRAVFDIAYGTVQSYGEVARRAGFTGGARFVGNTMANNRFPILIPCHRVIRADGALGGFGGGTDLKKRMIELEQKTVLRAVKYNASRFRSR
ncbi:methylated-DNA--[protein]-cysteine S-methyltransferase [Desulfosudis oleivorans]|uniref:Methylated-DNA--protein-cysteine methyltransferase n=1 Tax=Desulfosudis oleivorans (strain DSM 6200 / JCM 39069 / Hxd3) TaxID=96561 RepID=A8ZXL8_DESOH|nr:methylated-DNA--[protein]-cysteine S-methyltransferase [Desulfosudis oleivorans]ABW66976.1 methylated-DNA--protein-cysteine methyltransferase [Desulfosudis oleivorans Hxd3]